MIMIMMIIIIIIKHGHAGKAFFLENLGGS